MRIAALLLIVLFTSCKSKDDATKEWLIDRQLYINRYINGGHEANKTYKHEIYDKKWFDSLQRIIDSCEIALKRY
jgi:hypothetical protein